jgi:hypothetical protein
VGGVTTSSVSRVAPASKSTRNPRMASAPNTQPHTTHHGHNAPESERAGGRKEEGGEKEQEAGGKQNEGRSESLQKREKGQRSRVEAVQCSAYRPVRLRSTSGSRACRARGSTCSSSSRSDSQSWRACTPQSSPLLSTDPIERTCRPLIRRRSSRGSRL